MQRRPWAKTWSADPQPGCEPSPRCCSGTRGTQQKRPAGERALPPRELPCPPSQPAMTPRKRNLAGGLDQTQPAIQTTFATLHKQSWEKGGWANYGHPRVPHCRALGVAAPFKIPQTRELPPLVMPQPGGSKIVVPGVREARGGQGPQGTGPLLSPQSAWLQPAPVQVLTTPLPSASSGLALESPTLDSG